MGVKKTRKISFIFSTFLLKIVLGTILAVILPVVLVDLLMIYGYVLPANYSEAVAMAEAEAIENADDLYAYLEQVPGFIHYLVYDVEGNVLQTNMSRMQQEVGISYLQNGREQVAMSGNSRYIIAERDEVGILLHYTVKAHYVSETLESSLPSPDTMMIVLMFLFALVNSFLQVRLLARRFRRELQPLMQVTDEISKQNLDCEIPDSKVSEIQEILKSFSDMKHALKDSLQQQWKIQRTQKEQVAALAHDLKTPMTVTLGNLDLLCETRLDEEQRQLVEDAQEGLCQMSDYVGLLMEMTVASAQYQYHFVTIQMAELVENVCRKAEVLCKNKQLTFSVQGGLEAVEYRGDYTMLERALMNVIRNAVEHTPLHGEIRMVVGSNKEEIRIEITDSGCGFSEKMLKQGIQLFAMEDESRSGEAHYGMGLYFADSVFKAHEGQLVLSNDEHTGGAKLLMTLYK